MGNRMRQFKTTKSITNHDSASLDRYLQEIGREELLSVEDEVELAQKIKTWDREALDKLVRANLKFVVNVAKQYQNQWLPLGDLINEWNLGMIKAAQKFDETRWFKFISYAVRWIRQSILQALAENARLVRLPVNRSTEYNKIGKMISLLEQDLKREPTDEEIAEAMNVTVKKIKETMRNKKTHGSLTADIADDNELCLLDVLSNTELPPDHFVANIESWDYEFGKTLSKISEGRITEKTNKELAETITERDITIFKMFYDVGWEQKKTLDEIAEYFDLSRERVRQIKDMILKRLRKSGAAKPLKEFIGKV